MKVIVRFLFLVIFIISATVGNTQPVVSVQADSFYVAMNNCGQIQSETVAVINDGSTDLNFNLIGQQGFFYDSVSYAYYSGNGQTMFHTFWQFPNFGDKLTIYLSINGDYDEDTEFAELYIEGEYIGVITDNNAPNGTDIFAFYEFTGAQMKNWYADGKLEVSIVNSTDVGSEGAQYSYFEAILSGPEWLTFSSDAGTVAPGDTAWIDLIFTPGVQLAGLYNVDILLYSDDPVTPLVYIPVYFELNGTNDLTISLAGCLDFGTLPEYTQSSLGFYIANYGCEVLNISNITSTAPQFSPGSYSSQVLPGDSTFLPVEFISLVAGTFNGNINIFSDHIDTSICVTAIATETPEFTVNPASITAAVSACNQSDTQNFTISNNGPVALEYDYSSNCAWLVVTVTTVSWGSEISWELEDDLGGVLISSPTGAYANGNVYKDSVCIYNGDYTFLAHDSYGDGWNGGTYSITLNGVVVANNGGIVPPDYGTTESFSVTNVPEHPGWLSFSTVQGSIAGSSSQNVEAYFDATGFAAGTYTYDLLVATNDPRDYEATIPITFTVTGDPIMDVESDCIYFDTVIQYSSSVFPFTVYNNGCDTLIVSNTVSTNGDFSFQTPSFFVLPWMSFDLNVVFAPQSPGSYNADFTLFTNDGDTTICLQGFGLTPPVLTVVPDSLGVTFTQCDDFTTVVMSIQNNGTSNLVYSLEESESINKFNYAYIANYNQDMVTVFDVTSNTVVDYVTVGNNPMRTEITKDGRYVYVSNRGDGTVSVIRTSDNTIKTTINLTSGCCPNGLALTPDDDFLYVCDQWQPAIHKINCSNNTVVGTFYNCNQPIGIDITPDGQYAYVADRNLGVLVYRLSDNSLMTTIGGFFQTHSVEITPDGQYAFISDGESPCYIGVIDIATNTRIQSFGPYQNVSEMDISPDGQKLYAVSKWDDELIIIDVPSLTVENEIYDARFDYGWGIAVSPDGNYVYVGKAWNDPSLVVYNIATQTIESVESTTLDGSWGVSTLHRLYPGWLSEDNAGGVIPPGSSQNINVTFDGSNLNAGTYSAGLVIYSNDPFIPVDTIPCVMVIDAPPQLVMSDTCFNFDSIIQFDSFTDTIIFGNTGCDTLFITDITTSNPDLTVNSTQAMLLPGEQINILLTFNPQVLGDYSEIINVINNDSDTTICFNAVSTPPPTMLLSDFTVAGNITTCGDSTLESFTIYNTGSADLEYDVFGLPGMKEVEILVLTYGVGSTWYTTNAEAAITSTYPNVNFTELYSTDPAEVENGMIGKDMVLIPRVTTGDMNVFTAMGPVLQSFANGGGTVAICGTSQSLSLTNSGLFSGSYFTGFGSGNMLDIIEPLHPFCEGMPASIQSQSTTLTYSFTNPDKKRLIQYAGAYDVTTVRNLGAGNVVYLGFDYNSYTPEMALLIGNIAKNSVYNQNVNIDPVTGIIPIGDSAVVSVTLLSENLVDGSYDYYFQVVSNDPLNSSDTVICTVNLAGYPVMQFDQACLDFDTLLQYGTTVLPVGITNNGCDTLFFQGSSFSSADFSVDNDTSFIPAGSSATVNITFNPQVAGDYLEYFTMNTNGGDSTICLIGHALSPPVVDVQPLSIEVSSSSCNDTINNVITVSNQGSTDLIYSVSGAGENFDSTSFITMTSSGQDTYHYFVNTPYVADSVVVTVTINGDYDSSSEYAELIIDGVSYGIIPDNNYSNGTSIVNQFVYTGATAASMLSDGMITVVVANSAAVDLLGGRWNQVRLYIPGSVWLDLDSYSGTVPSSGSDFLNLQITTTNLITGIYTSDIVISSNDPLSPSDTISCTVNFTGYPVWSESNPCIDFDSILQFESTVNNVAISNMGCDTLFISDITSSSSDFSTDTTSLFILPGAEYVFNVTFSPTQVGPYSEQLTFNTNDGDHLICLNGYATSPPVISLSDSVFDVSITTCGDSVILPVTIYNSGDTTLFVEFTNLFSGSNFDVLICAADAPAALDDVSSKLLSTGKIGTVNLYDARNGTPTLAELESYDAVLIWSNSSFNNSTALGNVVADYVDQGGAVVCAVFATTGIRLYGRFNTENYWAINASSNTSGSAATLGTVYNSSHYIMDGVTSFHGGSYSWRPNTTIVEPGAERIADWSDGRPLIASKMMGGSRRVDLGFFPVSASYNTYSWQIATDGALIMANSLLWAAKYDFDWAASSTVFDTIYPGDSSIVNITVSTENLLPGNYQNALIINSNDPLSPTDSIFISLTYSGYPVATYPASCLEYDSIMQYTHQTMSFYIGNDGCDTLFVAGIANSGTDFIPDQTSFIVLPGDSVMVTVDYFPQSPGLHEDTLTVFTNDLNFEICMTGYSNMPPSIQVDPTSLIVNITGCEDTVLVPLTISNTGNADLFFSTDPEFTAFFDGNGDYIQMTDNSVFDVGTLTIEAWVYSGNFIQNGFIFEKGQVNTQYSLFFEGANLCFRTCPNTGGYDSYYLNSSSIGITSGSWHHVAATYDGTEKKIYVDGVLRGTQAYSKTLITGKIGQIIGAYGGSGGHAYYFNGSIDEVRVWDYARSISEIQENMHRSIVWPKAGLIGNWTFDDQTAHDFSGNGNDGILYNQAAIIESNRVSNDYLWTNYPFVADTLSFGENTVIDVLFTTSNLLSGVYTSQLFISSNDPLNPVDTVELNLTFNGSAEISIPGSCLQFDSIVQFSSDTALFWLGNTGCDTLFVSGLDTTNGYFETNLAGFFILPYDSLQLEVYFNPDVPGLQTGDLVLHTNLGDTSLCLTGYAYSPPVITIDPQVVNVSLNQCNDTIIVPLTLNNLGDTTLVYSAYITGAMGKSMYFDGNDYISLDGAVAMGLTNSSFTVQVWVMVPNMDGTQMTVLGTDNNITNQGLQLGLKNNKVFLGFTGNNLNGTTVLQSNKWYHITYRYNSSTGQQAIFLNGQLEIFEAGHADFQGLGVVNIGRWNGTAYFKGYMDGLRIWSYSRTGSQIAADYSVELSGTENNLEACYNFNQSGGSVLFDLTTNNHDGTINGNPQFSTVGVGFDDFVTTFAGNDSIVAGETGIMNLIVSSSGLVSGDYTAHVHVNSNDPISPTDTVLVNLQFNGYPVIDASDSCIVFDSIFQYTTQDRPLTIYNTGCDTLFISNITSANADISVDTASFFILPDDSLVVNATFAPLSTGLYTGNLLVQSNAGDTSICIAGFALTPPVINTNPLSFNEIITTCVDSVSLQLTVFNEGGNDLIYSVDTSAKYLTLDGSGDYLYLSSPNMPVGNKVTTEAWVRRSNLSDANYNGIVSWGNRYCTNTSFLFSMKSDGRPSMASWCNDVVPGSGPAAVQSEWTHVACVTNGTSVTFYVNGQPISGTLPYSLNVTNSINLAIGSTDWFGRYFRGDLDEIRVWNVARSQQEIINNMYRQLDGNEAGLMGYWNFDDNTANDLSGNGNNMSFAGNASLLDGGASTHFYNVSSASGSIAPGDSANIDLIFDMSGLYSGIYEDSVVIQTNDPLNPVWVVPIVINYDGIPYISTSDTCLIYDSIMQWTTQSLPVWVSNYGCDTLIVTDILSSNIDFTVDTASFIILPDDSLQVVVTFAPTSTGLYDETLTISSNAGNTNLCLGGFAVSPPILVVSPDSLIVNILACNDTVTDVIQIENTGDGDLIYSVSGMKALHFDGNDMVSIPNATDFDVSDFTYGAWINAGNTSGWRTIIDAGDDVQLLAALNGQYAIWGRCGANYIGTITPGWHYIAWSVTGNAWYVYEDGVLLGSGTSCSAGINVSQLTIGSGSGGNEFFDGDIAQVSVWNYGLSQSEISGLMNNPPTGNEPGLIGFWPFFESGAATTIDIGPNGNSGILSGPVYTSFNSPWAEINPITDTLLTSETNSIDVSLSSTGLSSGVYETQVMVVSNDPLQPLVYVPLVLSVQGYPVLGVSDSCITFDTILQYTTATEYFTVQNTGCDTLFISDITFSGSDFTVDTTNAFVLPGDSLILSVSFVPNAIGVYSEQFVIFNNDVDTTICLGGVSLAPPVIGYNPDSLFATLSGCEDSVYLPVQISNSGDYPLYVAIQADSSWLVLQDLSDTLYNGDTLNTQILFDAALLSPGLYECDVIISSNDPLNPQIIIPSSFVRNDKPGVPIVSDTAICFGQPTPAITAAGSSVQWYSDALLSNLIQSGNTLTISETLVGEYVYYVTQTLDGCEGYADSVIFTIYPIPSAPVASDEIVCSNQAIPDLSASGINISWYDNPILDSVIASGGYFSTGQNSAGVYDYFVTQTENGCESPADTATLEILTIPLPPVVTDNTTCFGASAPEIIATGNNINWYDDVALTNLIHSGDTLIPQDTTAGIHVFYVTQTDGVNGCESDAAIVNFTVNLPATPVSPDQSICVGDITPELITAGMTITWYADSLQQIVLHVGDTLVTGETAVGVYDYYVTQTDTATGCESKPDTVILVINDYPAAPSGLDTVVCSGLPVPLIEAVGQNINWYYSVTLDSLLSTGSQYNTGETNAGVYDYYATQTVNGCESTADVVTLTINQTPSAPVVSDTAICYGEVIPGLVALGDSITWYDSFVQDSVLFYGSTFIPTDSIASVYSYYATQTDLVNGCESQSSVVSFTVYPIPVAPVSSDEIVCSGQAVPDLVATGSQINWYSDSLLTLHVVSGSSLTTGETTAGEYPYFVTQTQNGCESPGLEVTLFINQTPVAPTVGNAEICYGDETPYLVASGTDIKWYADSTMTSFLIAGDSILPGEILPGSYSYFASQSDTVNGCESQTAEVVFTINAPSVATAPDTAICFGETSPEIIAMGANVSWYDDENLTSLIHTGDTLIPADMAEGVYTYYVIQLDTFSGCMSVPDTVTYTIFGIPAQPVSNDETVCSNQSIPALVATGSNINWYADSLLSNLLVSNDSLWTGQLLPGIYTYYATQGLNGCESPADTVLLTILDAPVQPIGNDTAICEGEALPTLLATGENLTWYSDPALTSVVTTGNSYLPVNSTPGLYTWYIADTDTGNLCMSLPDTVTFEIFATPVQPDVADVTVCEGDVIPPMVSSGSNVVWYSDSLLSVIVATGDTLYSGMTSAGEYTYYIQQSANGCLSPVDTAVLSINSIPMAPIATDYSICFGDTITQLIAIGTGITWYDDSLLSNAVYFGDTANVQITEPGVHTFYATMSVGGCEGPADTSTIFIQEVQPPLAADAEFCFGEVAELVASGANISWYADASMDSLLAVGDIFVTGDTMPGSYSYFVSQLDVISGCTSSADTVLITIHSLPAQPSGVDQVACAPYEVPVLTASGYNLTWYFDASLDSIAGAGDSIQYANSQPGDYMVYVTQSDSVTGCESTADTVFLTIHNAPLAPVVADVLVCYGNPVDDFIASGGNLSWYDSPLLDTVIHTGNTYSTGITAVGTYIYYVVDTDTVTGCISDATEVALDISNDASDPPVLYSNSICEGSADGILSADGFNIVWYSDSLMTDSLFAGNDFNTGISVLGEYTFWATQQNGCGISPVASTTLSVVSMPAAPMASDTSVCLGSSFVALEAIGVNIVWYQDSSLTSVLDSGAVYYAPDNPAGSYEYFVTQSNGCESEATIITLEVIDLPSTPIAIGDEVCQGDVGVLMATGNNLTWYSDSLLQNPVSADDTLYATGLTAGLEYYFVTQSGSGCESVPDTAVLIVNGLPAQPVAADSAACFGSAIPDLYASGVNVYWYSDSLLMDTVSFGNTFTTGETAMGVYTYYTQNSDLATGCVSEVTEVSLIISNVSQPPVAQDQSVCYGQSSAGLYASGYNVNWYSDLQLTNHLSAGNLLMVFDQNVGTYTYYATQTTECGESAPEPVVFTVNPLPLQPVPFNEAVCYGDTVLPLYAAGTLVEWFKDPYHLILVNTGNEYNTGETDYGVYNYYIRQTDTITGCISADTAITLIINAAPLVTMNHYSVNIIAGESVELEAYNAVSYTWTPAAGLDVSFGPVVVASPNTTTVYTVSGTDQYGCIGEASCIVYVDPFSIDEHGAVPALDVYPNPTSGLLNLEFTGLSEKQFTIIVRNTQGKEVYSAIVESDGARFAHQIDFGNMAHGVYTVQLVTKDYVINRKVILRGYLNK